MSYSRIAGTGSYLPEKVVTNKDLEKMVDTSDEWIRERTGIKRRHLAADNETTSDLALAAAGKALDMAGIGAEDLDLIVLGTATPDKVFPSTACIVQRRLGIGGCAAFDVHAACSGFVYGLSIADQYIKTGMYRNILLVGSEVQSRGIEFTTRGRDISVLFGDGAGAAVIDRSDNERGIITTHMHADGRFVKELWCEDPGSAKDPRITKEMVDSSSIWPYMNGRHVFKYAVTKFPEVIKEALDAAGINKDEVDLVIPHQANLRITEAVRMRLELPEEKVYSNIHKYGNTTAASIPIALSEAISEGVINEGSMVCLAAFGSGFTWASALLRL